ncbi:fructosamine kinase family protein [Nocardia sp. NPDC057030]|uniref:fructosamine kinase family protein n=1 Tax=unclassified Nocardia TaxID=2637762 RepID=UPI00362DB1AC
MSVAERLGALLGVAVHTVTDLGASHAWTLHRAELIDGRVVFVKASAEPSTVFAAEAAGLRWLATGAVPDAQGAVDREPDRRAERSVWSANRERVDPAAEGFVVAPGLLPDVLAADDRMIVLPWLEDVGPTSGAAERFGRELAALHANSATEFGAPWSGWIAELPLDNTLTSGPWAQWYAERRLAPYLPLAAPHLGRDGIRLLEQVIDRIDTLAGPPEPPARIHGDLWSGNIVWTPDRATLIDPAAHAGHRETDLAMLALFGAPHLDRIRAAYNETHPLSDGWHTRIPLHQLHPLLIHVILFGPSYRSQTLTAATTALSI